MTAPGLQRLEEELRHLKSVERPSIIRAIAEARSHGDLSENAEYHAARERQSFIEGRVIELEEIVSAAEVIEVDGHPGMKTCDPGESVDPQHPGTRQQDPAQQAGPTQGTRHQELDGAPAEQIAHSDAAERQDQLLHARSERVKS